MSNEFGHVEKISAENKPKNSVKLIDSTIFDNFKSLISYDTNERISGAHNLLQHLSKNVHAENEEENQARKAKENGYTLKRLIRGCGASTNVSRTGCFSTLVGYFSLKNDASGTEYFEEIFKILENQLHVGKEIINKEDSYAFVGQALVCGALLRSKLLLTADNATITKCTEILIRVSKHKIFHVNLAYTFLTDFVHELPKNQFIDGVWDVLKKELHRQWLSHTINTICLLMEIQQKYPNLVDSNYLMTSIQSPEFLDSSSYKQIIDIFWSPTTVTSINQMQYSYYETFATHLATKVVGKKIIKFWRKEVNEILSTQPNRLKELITIKIITKLMELSIDSTVFITLVSTEFLTILTGTLKNLKQYQSDEKHKYLIDIYNNFFIKFVNYMKEISSENPIKIEIIKKIILHPGLLLIDKFTINCKILQDSIIKLNERDLKQLYDIFKNIIIGKLMKKSIKSEKEEASTSSSSNKWLPIEKQYSLQMLQNLIGHKLLQIDFNWRVEQLKFLLKISLFYTDSNGEPCRKDSMDIQSISKDLWFPIKNQFYACLQLKMSTLKLEKKLLIELVNYTNEILASHKNDGKFFLKNSLETKVFTCWTNLISDINKSLKSDKSVNTRNNKNGNKLKLIFHILMLHMGLQLFGNDPQVAITAIEDLKMCMERAEKKITISNKYSRKTMVGNNSGMVNGEMEPKWIEVVIDLFLHLLSQNTSILRSIINKVFPYLCSSLNVTTIHQILSVLDMKNEKNPLSSKDDTDDNSSDDSDDEKDSLSSDDDENDDDDDEDDDNEDDEEGSDDYHFDEEGTVSDQLRNAVSMALVQCNNNSIIAGADDDTKSIDLNDMSDDECERLDNALSAAFKLMSESSKKSKKKSKEQRFINTTVMHFRIRVLDLIEMFLKYTPSMLLTLEIILPLYSLYEQCLTNEKDLQPLFTRLNRIFKKLLTIKNFTEASIKSSDTEDCSEIVSESNLVTILKVLIGKKLIHQNEHQQLLSKCVQFLIGCSQTLAKQKLKEINNKNQSKKKTKQQQKEEAEDPNANDTLLATLKTYFNEFIIKRNPLISFNLLQDLFKLRWHGIWTLTECSILENGFNSINNTRNYRRIQLIELLTILYKNYGFIEQEFEQFNKINLLIERKIDMFLNWLQNCHKDVSAKEFTNLLQLLLAMHKCHEKFKQKLKTQLQWHTVGERVQNLRQNVVLSSFNVYIQFCRVLGIKVLNKTFTRTNDKSSKNDKKSIDKNVNNIGIDVENENENKKKRKAETSQNKRQKKLKKEERLRVASEGLTNHQGFSFELPNSEEDTEVD